MSCGRCQVNEGFRVGVCPQLAGWGAAWGVNLVKLYSLTFSLGLESGKQAGMGGGCGSLAFSDGVWKALLIVVETAAVNWIWLGGWVPAGSWEWEGKGWGHCGEKQ